MDLKQLRTFIMLARIKSFTQTAKNLNYAQSTITNQIQLLEEELKVKLFERLGHIIALTPEGSKLLPYAESIIKLADEARMAIDSSDDVPKGTLSIGALESICITRLPKLLNEYRKRYPLVEIILKFGGTEYFRRCLTETTIDIAFCIDKEITDPQFIKEFSYPEPLALISAPDHPLACKDAICPEDLNDQHLILTEKDCSYRVLFEKMVSDFGIKPRSIMETGNVHAIKQFTTSGLGITLLPMAAVEEELYKSKLVKLNWTGPVFELRTQVIYHKNKWISSPLRALIDLLHEIGL